MRSDDCLHDFCDGSLFKNHQLFQAFPDALQLIIYFDELEVCNPLGSHSGVHKVGKGYVATLLASIPESKPSCTLLELLIIITINTFILINICKKYTSS